MAGLLKVRLIAGGVEELVERGGVPGDAMADAGVLADVDPLVGQVSGGAAGPVEVDSVVGDGMACQKERNHARSAMTPLGGVTRLAVPLVVIPLHVVFFRDGDAIDVVHRLRGAVL